jgi:hypothetical protein
MQELAERIEHDGFAIVPNVVPAVEVDRLIAAIERLQAQVGKALRGGIRNVFSALPFARELACSPGILQLMAAVLGADCFAVRGILFDKTQRGNWKVAWHQAGIPHVRAPAAVLERMLAVRIHLDDCEAGNGPLRVIPGSHRNGILSPSETQACLGQVPARDCHVPRGGVLLMRPLLLHSSSEALVPSHRRVLHLEYAVTPLPAGLEWHERHGPAPCAAFRF